MDKPKHWENIDLDTVDWTKKDQKYWQEVLPANTYYITREKGTERPFTGEYTRSFEDGQYLCYCCGQPLFTSEDKFESHCGWPSFSKVADQNALEEKEDRSLMMERTEVLCSRCGAHLGHVFDDGPPPSGLRYCINSQALVLRKLP